MLWHQAHQWWHHTTRHMECLLMIPPRCSLPQNPPWVPTQPHSPHPQHPKQYITSAFLAAACAAGTFHDDDDEIRSGITVDATSFVAFLFFLKKQNCIHHWYLLRLCWFLGWLLLCAFGLATFTVRMIPHKPNVKWCGVADCHEVIPTKKYRILSNKISTCQENNNQLLHESMMYNPQFFRSMKDLTIAAVFKVMACCFAHVKRPW